MGLYRKMGSISCYISCVTACREIQGIRFESLGKSSFKIELLHLMKEKLMTPVLTCLLHQSKIESRDQSRGSNKNCISQDEMVKSIRKSSNSSVLSSRILAAKSYLILLEQTKIETASEPSQVPFRNSNLGGCV